MISINDFSLEKHSGPYKDWPQRTRLIRNGLATDTLIPGYVIEAQYRNEHGFLLLTSWDCLFEEAQTFVLLSPELDYRSHKTKFIPYSSIWLEGHEIVNEHSVLFHFDIIPSILATINQRSKLKLKNMP